MNCPANWATDDSTRRASHSLSSGSLGHPGEDVLMSINSVHAHTHAHTLTLSHMGGDHWNTCCFETHNSLQMLVRFSHHAVNALFMEMYDVRVLINLTNILDLFVTPHDVT